MKNSNHFSRNLSLRCASAIGMLLLHTSLEAGEKALASFKNDDSLESWTSVNDGVMGGVSKGGFERLDEGTLLFKGELSLENNGGFASIRTKPAKIGFAGANAIVVKAKGDGRTYWVDLRVTNQMSATSYRAYLSTTAGEWKETTIPFTDFKPQAFGQELPYKAIDPADLASIGFTLADKKAGAFALEIEFVKATDEAKTEKKVGAGGNTIVDVAAAAGSFKTLLTAAKAAGLADVLAGEGPFTVLAPTEEAFAKLPDGTVAALLKPENKDQLVAILKNHVIAGKVTLVKALDAGSGESLYGSKISFQFEDGRVRVGNAALIKADIAASNGIIHVIDQILLPAIKETKPLSSMGLIELAIDRGVTLFNNDETAACAAIYEVTCEALRVRDDVSEDSRKVLGRALKAASAEKSDREKAWILRAGIDRTAENLESAKK
jgi:uncharacterized surface protein with fasciclin (FAS1) repeats